MTDHDQLDENLRAMAEPFTPKDERMLTAQLAAISRNYCRMCGAPIASVARFSVLMESRWRLALAKRRN